MFQRKQGCSQLILIFLVALLQDLNGYVSEGVLVSPLVLTLRQKRALDKPYNWY